jgi:hypothetical protein
LHGLARRSLLRRFLPFLNGTPAHDHPGDIFATLDARAFQTCEPVHRCILKICDWNCTETKLKPVAVLSGLDMARTLSSD